MRFQALPVVITILAASASPSAHAIMGSFNEIFTFREDQKSLVEPKLLTQPQNRPAVHVVGPTYDNQAGAGWAAHYTRADMAPTTYMDSSSMVMRPSGRTDYPAPAPRAVDADFPAPAWPMPTDSTYRQPQPGYGYGYGPANIPPGYAAMAWRHYQNMLQQQQDPIFIGDPGTSPMNPQLGNSQVGRKTMVGDPVYPWHHQPTPIDYDSLARRGMAPNPVVIEDGSGNAYQAPYSGNLPNQYQVRAGDTLSTISGQEQIYNDWQMWPLIYDANQHQISDPDLLYPQQSLGIPRDYSQQDAHNARLRARDKVPPHSFTDGY